MSKPCERHASAASTMRKLILGIGGTALLFAALLTLCRPNPGGTLGSDSEPTGVATLELAAQSRTTASLRSRIPTSQPPQDQDAASARIDPSPRGRGDLHGRVLDARRHPIAAAHVQLKSTPGSAPHWADLEDDRNVAIATAAGDDGTFSFAELPHGPYLARAVRGESATAWTPTIVSAVTPPLELTVAASLRDFRVQVVTELGELAADAEVRIVLGVPLRRASRTPELGASDPARAAQSALDTRTDAAGIARFAILDSSVGFVTVTPSLLEPRDVLMRMRL